jgi:hypothetical protein
MTRVTSRMLLAALLAAPVGVALGCSRPHDRIGDAPRTVKASALAGWKEVNAAGVTLRFPEAWKVMDFATNDVNKGLDTVFGNDPKFAEARAQAQAAARQGLVKIFAIDASNWGKGFATNANVIVQNLPRPVTLEQATEGSAKELEPLLAPGTRPQIEYVDVAGGKVAAVDYEMKPPNPAVPSLSIRAYLAVSGQKMALATFTSAADKRAQLKEMSQKAMEVFRFAP